MKNNTLLYLSVFFLINTFTINAEPVSIDIFLKTAFNDSIVIKQKESIKESQKILNDIPVIDDLEFRIQNKSWDIQNDKYTIRVGINGLGETHAKQSFIKKQIAQNEQRVKKTYNSAIKERYDCVIDMLEQQAFLMLKKNLILVYEDRVKVLESRKNSEDFDLNDLIDAEHSLSKLQSEKFEIQKLINILQKKVVLLSGMNSVNEFDTTDLIPADSVIAIVKRSIFTVDSNNVHLMGIQREFELARSRYKLEKAENRRYINYVEFAYDNGNMRDELSRKDIGKSYNTNKAYSVEVGLSIPGFKANALDISKRQESFLKAQIEYEELKRELQVIMNDDLEDIYSYIGQYQYLRARETQVDAEASLKKYLQITGTDPLVLLSIKEGLIKNSIKIQEVRFGILRNYINVLDVSGKLSNMPIANYLSNKEGEL